MHAYTGCKQQKGVAGLQACLAQLIDTTAEQATWQEQDLAGLGACLQTCFTNSRTSDAAAEMVSRAA